MKIEILNKSEQDRLRWSHSVGWICIKLEKSEAGPGESEAGPGESEAGPGESEAGPGESEAGTGGGSFSQRVSYMQVLVLPPSNPICDRTSKSPNSYLWSWESTRFLRGGGCGDKLGSHDSQSQRRGYIGGRGNSYLHYVLFIVIFLCDSYTLETNKVADN